MYIHHFLQPRTTYFLWETFLFPSCEGFRRGRISKEKRVQVCDAEHTIWTQYKLLMSVMLVPPRVGLVAPVELAVFSKSGWALKHKTQSIHNAALLFPCASSWYSGWWWWQTKEEVQIYLAVYSIYSQEAYSSCCHRCRQGYLSWFLFVLPMFIDSTCGWTENHNPDKIVNTLFNENLTHWTVEMYKWKQYFLFCLCTSGNSIFYVLFDTLTFCLFVL